MRALLEVTVAAGAPRRVPVLRGRCLANGGVELAELAPTAGELERAGGGCGRGSCGLLGVDVVDQASDVLE